MMGFFFHARISLEVNSYFYLPSLGREGKK